MKKRIMKLNQIKLKKNKLNKMKLNEYVKQVVAFTLAFTVMTTQIVISASAAELPTNKEEVVYAMLGTDGNVTGVYVVNSFTDKNITDYGKYLEVRNLTTTDEIKIDGESISIETKADKIYYQGNLETKEIPWNIEIHYFIDDKEYSAKEIAGMSGKLKITINIRKNENCNEAFWEGYALQTSLSLDAKICKNIVSEGATIANVGSSKQLSYIVMPGKGTEIEITADVTDFEMSGILINGTKLSLDIEMENEKLTNKVEEIKEAVKELDTGAGKLNDGSSSLLNGANDLYGGTVEVKEGTSTIQSGVKELNNGISTMQSALDTLDSQSETLVGGSAQTKNALNTIKTSLNDVSIDVERLGELSEASTQIKTGIDSLVLGLQMMNGSIDKYYNTLSNAGISDVLEFANTNVSLANALGISDTQRAVYEAFKTSGDSGVMDRLTELVRSGDSEALELFNQYNTEKNVSVIEEYVINAGRLISVETVLLADSAYIEGSDTLISGIKSQLDENSGELIQGALTLKESYGKFDESIQSLVSTLQNLTVNMAKLKSGIDELVINYDKLDDGTKEYTEAVSRIVAGYEQIYDGSLSLAGGTDSLYNGTVELVDGAIKLCNGSTDLKEGMDSLTEGTSQFYESTLTIDSEISNAIDETITDLTGKDVETVSFVSEKNTEIESVLFVIKTPAIEKAEIEEIQVEEEEHLNWWQKFLRLFGLY